MTEDFREKGYLVEIRVRVVAKYKIRGKGTNVSFTQVEISQSDTLVQTLILKETRSVGSPCFCVYDLDEG